MAANNPDLDPRVTPAGKPGGSMPPGETPPAEAGPASDADPHETRTRGWYGGPTWPPVPRSCRPKQPPVTPSTSPSAAFDT
ncbi:DUF6480 family protein [Streptomyces sp. R41]|uniref:DUF6480 family protein n=1 Tax=Streptomyces sp. R41 TaxID=3238632 RepID=A0AB39RSR2_9ACTN